MQVVNVGGVQYLITPQGLVPLQIAVQMLQQQNSSLQAKPEGGIGGGFVDGLKGALTKKGKDTVLAGKTQEESILDKVGNKLAEALGLKESSNPHGIISAIDTSGVSKVPSFGLQETPLNLGVPSDFGLPAPETNLLDLGVKQTGGSAIPDVSGSFEVPDFSLGAEAPGVSSTATTAPGMFSLKGIGAEGNVLLPIAGAAGLYNLFDSQGDAPSGGGRNIRGFGQGAASGAAIGSYFGPWGAGIGAGIGGLGGLAGSLFGSSKGERQMTRDEWRKKMVEQGFLDDNYQGTLADNTPFDFGKDKFTFGTGEGAIDLSKPAVSRAAAWGNALAGLSGFGGGKNKEAISTQFTQAGTSNLKDPNDIKTVRDNYKHFLQQYGINNATDAHKAYDQASAANGASQQEWGMGTSAIDEIFNDRSGFDANGKWVG